MIRINVILVLTFLFSVLTGLSPQNTSWQGTDEIRYLEIVSVEEFNSKIIHMALVNRDCLMALDKVIEVNEVVEEALKKAEAARENEDKQRDALVGKANIAARKLKREMGKYDRALRPANSQQYRSLFIVHCWDGFAKEPVDLWLAENHPLLKKINRRQSNYISGVLLPVSLDFLRGHMNNSHTWEIPYRGDLRLAIKDTSYLLTFDISGSLKSRNVVVTKADSVKGLSYILGQAEIIKEPEGFLKNSYTTDTMPWDKQPVTELDKIMVSVTECNDASNTSVHVLFQPTEDGKALASVRFKVYALDSSGGRIKELTQANGMLEYNLAKTEFGYINHNTTTNAIFALIDPLRRYAHGYEVVIVSAEYWKL